MERTMSEKISYEKLIKTLETKKAGDREWFLSLLDYEKQKEYEDEHMNAVMQMLRIARIRPQKNEYQTLFLSLTFLPLTLDHQVPVH